MGGMGENPSKTLKSRCQWANTELSVVYHDTEWGVPCHDDRALFELLILEGAQAGLSWSTILNKRDGYRRAFDNFDPQRVARYDSRKVRQLLANPEIVRNRLKIAAAVAERRAFLAVQKEFGSFDAYVWRFVGGRPIHNRRRSLRRGSRPDAGIRRDEQGPDEARVQIRGLDDLLRVHAGDRNGERSRGGVLPVSGNQGT